MIEKLTFQTHPLKDDIVKRWNEGQSNKKINLWLKAEHPNVVLSIATLCKHHNRFKFNKERLSSADSTKTERERKSKKQLPIETILWETIAQCRKMKKSPTIAVKDWQYLDQQLQSAVEKLMRIQDSVGDVKDISLVLSEIFAKIEAGEEVEVKSIADKGMDEKDKLKIVQEVDDENKQKPDSEISGTPL